MKSSSNDCFLLSTQISISRLRCFPSFSLWKTFWRERKLFVSFSKGHELGWGVIWWKFWSSFNYLVVERKWKMLQKLSEIRTIICTINMEGRKFLHVRFCGEAAVNSDTLMVSEVPPFMLVSRSEWLHKRMQTKSKFPISINFLRVLLC